MKLVVIDDDPEIHQFVDLAIGKRFELAYFSSAEEASNAFDDNDLNLALIDWYLPGMSGLDLVRELRSRKDGDRFHLVVFTAHHSPQMLREVLDSGADDYFIKPLVLNTFRIRMEVAERLAFKAASKVALEREYLDLKSSLNQHTLFHNMVGRSENMQRVFGLTRQLGQVDVPVLIQGETGTGKDLVAHAIHKESHRRSCPFIPVNCGGLSEGLIASQLFGHRRGAFTGAISDQKGVFEAAKGGTLFLDEIGDLPLNLQANFLRALESREVTRIGETTPRKTDVRIVAATHHNLERLVDEGRFRGDLLYRIKVGRIEIPNLTSRLEDLAYLVTHFINIGSVTMRKKINGFQAGVIEKLCTHHWPGNIRELRNAVDFAMIQCTGHTLSCEDFPFEIRTSSPRSSRSARQRTESETFMEAYNKALQQCGGNQSKAATHLGISRATLYRKLKKYT